MDGMGGIEVTSLFISYSGKDISLAKKLAECFKEQEFRFLDGLGRDPSPPPES